MRDGEEKTSTKAQEGQRGRNHDDHTCQHGYSPEDDPGPGKEGSREFEFHMEISGYNAFVSRHPNVSSQ